MKKIMKESKLYQCPYNETIKCVMDESCLYCEDFKGIKIIKKKVKTYDVHKI